MYFCRREKHKEPSNNKEHGTFINFNFSAYVTAVIFLQGAEG